MTRYLLLLLVTLYKCIDTHEFNLISLEKHQTILLFRKCGLETLFSEIKLASNAMLWNLVSQKHLSLISNDVQLMEAVVTIETNLDL